MPVATVNGIRLYYETTGAGAPSSAYHGYACGVRSWDPQVRAFSRSRKRPTIYALEPRLRELRVPTLLIVGEHDQPCLKTHRFMAECIQGASHLMIRDVGHLTNLEAPGAFNAAVKRFLAR
jgi:pimeloyl-ACP methyl ester carboxylesterase